MPESQVALIDKLDSKVDEEELMKLLETYLKLKESIQFELVPGTDYYIDKKAFKWSLTQIDENGLDFKVKFDHPEYISFGGIDTLKVTINNSEEFLQPQNQALKTISDGFTIVIKLPPQGDNVLSAEELANA